MSKKVLWIVPPKIDALLCGVHFIQTDDNPKAKPSHWRLCYPNDTYEDGVLPEARGEIYDEETGFVDKITYFSIVNRIQSMPNRDSRIGKWDRTKDQKVI